MAVGVRVSLQVALLMVAAASSAFFPPLTEEFLHKRTDEYKLHINEMGAEFEEVVQVNVSTNIERIYVPAHNDVQETHFYLDYNKNLTVRLLPAVGRCYVSELDVVSRQVSPRGLKASLQAAKTQHQSSESTIVTYKWRMSGQLSSDQVASLLAVEAQQLCEGYPVYRLLPLKETVEVEGTLSRDRRQVDIGSNCFRGNQKLRCLRGRAISSCRYIYVQTCDSRVVERRTEAVCRDNNTLHIFDQIICCQECCSVQSQSDPDFFPYCPDLTKDDIPRVC